MIIKKFKNGKKIVQTTSEEFEKNTPKPDVIINKTKKKKILPVRKVINKSPVKKPRRKRGCGCGR